MFMLSFIKLWGLITVKLLAPSVSDLFLGHLCPSLKGKKTRKKFKYTARKEECICGTVFCTLT